MLLISHMHHLFSVSKCQTLEAVNQADAPHAAAMQLIDQHRTTHPNCLDSVAYRWISNSIEVAHTSDRPAQHMHTPSNWAACKHMLSNWVGYNGYMLIHKRTDLAALLPFTTGEQRKNNASPMHPPPIWGEMCFLLSSCLCSWQSCLSTHPNQQFVSYVLILDGRLQNRH